MMNKFILIVFILLVGFVFSQQRNSQEILSLKLSSFSINSQNNLCDTISNVDFKNDSAFLFTNTGTGNWGYVSGTNSYKDLSKAEKFFSGSYTSGYQLAGGIFYFAKSVDGNDSSQMKISVWDDDGTGGYPKTLLGSQNAYVKDFNSDSTYTQLMFAQPIPVQGNFYFGLDGFVYDSPQSDTVALYSSSKNVFTNTAYEMWIDSSWHAFNEPNNWNFKSRFFIAAILCNTDVGEYEIVNTTDEPVFFPNPAKDNLYINLGKSNLSYNEIKLMDASGRLVMSKCVEGAKNQIVCDISFLDVGFYTVTLSSGNRVFKRKIVIR
jgi:hypothetical protein